MTLQVLRNPKRCVKQRATIERDVMRVLDHKYCKCLTLELQKRNDIIDEDIQVVDASSVRYDDGER